MGLRWLERVAGRSWESVADPDAQALTTAARAGEAVVLARVAGAGYLGLPFTRAGSTRDTM